MFAHTKSMMSMLSEHRRYLLPATLQRRYCWKNKNWEELWNDYYEYASGQTKISPDLGDIIIQFIDDTCRDVIVVEGQQRLITTAILLVAIRDTMKISSDPDVVSSAPDITKTLTLKRDKAYFSKITPYPLDKIEYDSIVHGTETNKAGLMTDAYKFFMHKLKKCKLEPEEILDAITATSIVEKQANHNEDVMRLFRNHNAKGLPLAETDLIRHHAFSTLANSTRRIMAEKLWLTLEEEMPDVEKFVSFVRHYLMSAKNAPVSKKDICLEFKKIDTEIEVVKAIEDMIRYREYDKSIREDKDKGGNISVYLRLLNRFKIEPIYPMLMKLYDDSRVSDTMLEEILKISENIAIRRFMTGVISMNYVYKFAEAYDLMQRANFKNYIKILIDHLVDREYPTDHELIAFFADQTLANRNNPRMKLILERICPTLNVGILKPQEVLDHIKANIHVVLKTWKQLK